ncbi:MAG TPA: hypothetical protein VIL86_09390, partial [Tepidisphaeraceae bacterium]
AVYDAAPSSPARAAAGGQMEHVDYSNLGDVVVWLEPAAAGAGAEGAKRAAAERRVEIDTRNPSTKVHAAAVGERIVLVNHSGRAISFYSVSDGNDFTLKPIPAGGEDSYTVRSQGLIEILADPSLPPVALVYAAPSPWVAEARSGRSIVFSNLPPGEYQAVSWHPRLPGASVDFKALPNQTAHVTLGVGVKYLAGAGAGNP